MGENPSDFLKGGRFNPRWLMECAMIEAIQEGRPMTFLGTTQAAFTALNFRMKQFGKLILRKFIKDVRKLFRRVNEISSY